MKWLLSLSLFIATTTPRADVQPRHVEDMLEQMVRENVISAVEAEKAKIRLRGMSADQWKAINGKAQTVASRVPASVSHNKIEEIHGIDLDGAQFKEIQKEMKKIVPEYRD